MRVRLAAVSSRRRGIFRQVPFAQPQENHRGDDEDMNETRQHAADNRSGDGAHYFRAGVRDPKDWQQ